MNLQLHNMKNIITYINESLQLGQDNRNKKFEEIVNKAYSDADEKLLNNKTNGSMAMDIFKQFAIDIVSAFPNDIVKVEMYNDYQSANFGWEFYDKRNNRIHDLKWHNARKEWQSNKERYPISVKIDKFIMDNSKNYIK